MKTMQIGVAVVLVAIGFTVANGLRRSDATPAVAATTVIAQELTAADRTRSQPNPASPSPSCSIPN